MNVFKSDRAFTIVLTSCFLAVEFIMMCWWWTPESRVLWWLLLPVTIAVVFIVLGRRANRPQRRGD